MPVIGIWLKVRIKEVKMGQHLGWEIIMI